MKKWITLIVVLVVLILLAICVYIGFNNSSKQVDITPSAVTPNEGSIEEILLEDAIQEGCFVITNDRIYNKDILEKFINNTEIGSKNRIEDKIRIVEYNYDGYPTIYDLEYKIYDETYMNEEKQEVHKSGYVLTTDARRNNLVPRDIITNDDIPGEYYTITLREDSGINAAIISLSLCAEINTSDVDKKPYQDIEVARYLLTDKNMNAINIQEAINNPTIMGIVEINHNGYIYIFGGQHFGELGYEIEEYTSSNIDNNNQICIDYVTLKKYDTRYIEEGDLLICVGNLTKYNSYGDGNFDTEDNPIIVLKSEDYDKMKQDTIKGTRKATITIGDIYDEQGYLYLKYDFEDSTHSTKTTYHFPFIQKVYITDYTKVSGILEKGKIVKVEYENTNSNKDGLELKSIQVVK